MSPFSPPLVPEKRGNERKNRGTEKQWEKRHRDGQMVFPFKMRKVIAFLLFASFYFFFLLPSPFLPLNPCTVVL